MISTICRTVGANVRFVYLAITIGGTRQRVDSGGSPDLEPKGMHEDIRHKIYIASSR
jgi:hypothetical protein